MDLGLFDNPSKRAPIETLLAALANCPDLKSLELARARPNVLGCHQANYDVVVQLHRLQRFWLEFNDPPTTRFLLSHIEYPESAQVILSVAVGWDADISEIVYQVLPRGNTDTLRYFRKAQSINVFFCDGVYTFSAGRSTIHCMGEDIFARSTFHGRYQPVHNSLEMTLFTSKFFEVIGSDTLELYISGWSTDMTEGLWGAVLHGLPRLERFSYQCHSGESDQDVAHSFVSVFSRPFSGVPVFPQLQYLELPRRLLAHEASAALLKRALADRVATSRRLKWIGISKSGEVGGGDRSVLERFRSLVEDVQT
jgi:hypothetical protein